MFNYKFNVELCPRNLDDIPDYCKKIDCLFDENQKVEINVGIASKPSKTASGYYKSYNLAKHLLTKRPDLNIIIHLTCKDLNKTNFRERLKAIKELGVDQILVITGDDYTKLNDDDQLFSNSEDLIEHIMKECKLFKMVGAAGYPGGNGKESHNDQEELERLRKKLELGIGSIHTQCVFEAEAFYSFETTIKREFESVDIVPSIALFNDITSFNTVARLTRVANGREKGQLLQELPHLPAHELHSFALRFLAELCKSIRGSRDCLIANICMFDRFEFALELLRTLDNEA